MTGRPTIFDQGVFDEILERHSRGATIAACLRSVPGTLEGYEANAGKPMPSPRTFYRWLEDEGSELLAEFARARTVAENMLGDAVLDIAMTQEVGREDKLMFREIPDEETGVPTNELAVVERKESDALGHRKFKAWAILQILARWNPGKWGARMNVEHEGLDNLADSIRQARERASSQED